MTLKEWLIENHNLHCYKASNVTESVQHNEDEKPKEVKIAEVWRIPLGLLDKEIEVK